MRKQGINVVRADGGYVIHLYDETRQQTEIVVNDAKLIKRLREILEGFNDSKSTGEMLQD